MDEADSSQEIERTMAAVISRVRARHGVNDPILERRFPESAGWSVSLGFGKAHSTQGCLRTGFSSPESDFVWTEGRESQLLLPVPPRDCDVLLEVELTPHLSPSVPVQTVFLVIRDTTVGVWRVDRHDQYRSVLFSRWFPRHIPCLLHLQLPAAFRPDSRDQRVLGIALHRLKMEALVPR